MAGTATDRVIAPPGGAPSKFADRALLRMADAPLIPGNSVTLLRDAAENYPAWKEAIKSAKREICFETYSFRADRTGLEFAALLELKAREGVRVRLIYDWLGSSGLLSYFFWRRLQRSGVELRCFHPPRLIDPTGALGRDHRKIIVVDGGVGFVSGLCVSHVWEGDPRRGTPPWRDTGVRIEGPAVSELSRTFERMWNLLGAARVSAGSGLQAPTTAAAGAVPLRIVPGEPGHGGLYRMDLMLAAMANQSIWLTDAYFFATPSFVQALRSAALDGVDVRLLLPRTSDIPIVRAMSRVGYRTLLEAGVRIFEWNGSMLHAKTAVVDERWARVGSTNLNLASWVSNYELDVVVEDALFARNMKKMYLDDLANATEIVLSDRTRVRPLEPRPGREAIRGRARRTAGRAATGAIAMGSTAGVAITRPRLLGPAESPIMVATALLLLGLAILAALFPRTSAFMAAGIAVWLALTLLIKAMRLYLSSKQSNREHSSAGTGSAL
jgi:cardiolipin synthase